MGNRKNLGSFIFLVILSHAGFTSQIQELRMEVRIFQIPPFQSFVKSEPSPPAKKGVEGGIVGTMTGGNVTVRFPKGIVILESDIIEKNPEIMAFIKRETRSIFPDLTQILPVADIIMLVEAENLRTSVIEEIICPPKYKNVGIDYKLLILPISIEEEEMVFKIQFSAKYKNAEGDRKKLLCQVFQIPYSRMLILGFPTNDERGRGTVYWLALYFEEREGGDS